MLEFVRLTSDEIDRVKDAFRKYPSLSSDCTAGVVFIWNDFFDAHIAFVNDEPVFMLRYEGNIYFSFPQSGNYKCVCALIDEYCREKNLKVRYLNVIESDFQKLGECYGSFEKDEIEIWADYVYDASAILELKGKKYNTQRNHINKFMRLYPDYSFEDMTDENIERCLSKLKKRGQEKDSLFAQSEYLGAMHILENYNRFDFIGKVLIVGDEIAGFTCAEVNGNCMTIHIEKADTDFEGVYPTLANLFLKSVLTPDIKYVNREDDAGDEGLRKSKMSLHPLLLLSKYKVTIP